MEPTEERDGVLLRLLQSGKFSDLQLSCEGRNFAVHKNIVCEQSPVINAACQGSFEVRSGDSRAGLKVCDLIKLHIGIKNKCHQG